MKRCSNKAYAMCPYRHMCGSIEDATFSEGSECDSYNQEVESKPMTNGDRIRSMSDEELCEMLMSDVPCEIMMSREDCLVLPCDCGKCILKWLHEPPKEETL